MQENNSIQLDDIPNDYTTYLSVYEMAKMLSIARATAYQLAKTKNFPCFYIGKRIIIPLSSLHKWAEKQANSQAVLIER